MGKGVRVHLLGAAAMPRWLQGVQRGTALGGPTGLGPGGLLQELHSLAVGVQDGAQEAAEEEKESREALGLAELWGIHSQIWGRLSSPQPRGAVGEPPSTL